MPFKPLDDVAERVNGTDKLSDRKLRQFMHVWNSCFEDGDDESTCYAKAWGAVNNTASNVTAKIEFTFDQMERKIWRDAISDAMKRQGIVFDLENDDSCDKPQIVKAGEYEVGDEKKAYRFVVQLCEAGGDWQNPTYYYRVQCKDGYLSVEPFNYRDDRCMVYIPVDGNNNLVKSKKDDKLVPTDTGKPVKPDEKALKADLIAFLEKLIELSKTAKTDEKAKLVFEDGRIVVAKELLRIAKELMV